MDRSGFEEQTTHLGSTLVLGRDKMALSENTMAAMFISFLHE